jgi:hypothetical protein
MSIIRLPLLIHDDGTYTTLHDSIRMDFEPCPELPMSDPDQQNSSTVRLTELIADLCITTDTNTDIIESSNVQSVPCPWPIILDHSATRRRIGRPTTFKNYATKPSMVNSSAPYKRRHTVRNL